MKFKVFSNGFALCVVSLSLNAYASSTNHLEKYVVLLNPQAGSPSRVAAEAANRTSGKVGYVYSSAFNGFSISLPKSAVEKLKTDKRFAIVAPDIAMYANAPISPTGHAFVNASNVMFTDGAIPEPQLLIDEQDNERVSARVAVLDTGIDHNHRLLNVSESVDCMVKTSKGAAWNASYGCESGAGRGMDGNGHGTHVAGTIGALDTVVATSDGIEYHLPGIATGVELVAVKVLDDRGSGYVSTILAGLDWVYNQNLLGAGIAVVNMSLGGSTSSIDAFNAYTVAIDNLVKAGTTVVVAAGNENELLSSEDSNYRIPAEVESALTVAALDAANSGVASFSNYGDVVDIYAPGTNVLSTYPGNQIATLSGTSMAAPYVAGAVALLAARDEPWTLAKLSATESPIPGFPTLSVNGVVTIAKAPTTSTGGGSSTDNTGDNTSPSGGKGRKK